GISADMRELESSNAQEAKEAIELFCRMAAQHIGGLMALLGGLDVLVFTGGIGEHSSRVREHICAYLKWAGVSLDEAANRSNAAAIHAQNGKIGVYTLPTD